ncbi:twin-arginine translocation signal domain-containing protein, partial [Cupriavidus sp. 2MCAB6]
MITRRDMLKTGAVVAAAGFVAPHHVLAQDAVFAPSPGAWRNFEVLTRLELPAKGRAQAW